MSPSLVFALSFALAQAPATENPAAPPAEPAKTEPVKSEPAPTAAAPVTHWYDKFAIDGFARLGVFYTFPFSNDELVGSHGGFRMADVRFGLEYKPIDKFSVYSSLSLSAPLVDPNDPLAGRNIVDLRDAYLQYELHDALVVRLGQFRPPYDAEMLVSDALVAFTGRSILAQGVTPPEGYPRAALAPERQIGLQLGSKRLGSALGFRYAVGVFNGNGLNTIFNDNNSVMPVGRLEVDYDKKVTLGVNASYNILTQGPRTARLNTTQTSFGADLLVKIWQLDAMVVFLGRQSSFDFAGLAPELGLGTMGQLHYLHPGSGLEAAVRFAWYEPSSAQADDQISELTAMVGWRPFELPFRVLLQYTHREEEQKVSIPNDSLDLMIHAVW
jgi:hypothetical protein